MVTSSSTPAASSTPSSSAQGSSSNQFVVQFQVVGMDGKVEAYSNATGHVFVDLPEGRREIGMVRGYIVFYLFVFENILKIYIAYVSGRI